MALTKVSSSLVSDNAVTSGKIADGGIATADIADVAVTTAKIANNAILTQHIDDGQVTTAQLGADAVTADKIANDAISEEHLDITVITSLSAVTAATGDLLMVADVSDSNNLKKIPTSSILSLAAAQTHTGGSSGTHTGAVNTSGTISSGAITSTGLNSTSGTVQFVDGFSAFDSSDASGYARFTTTNASAQIGLFRSGTSAGGSYIGADSSKLLRVYNSSFSPKFDIDTSGNVTAEGNITTANTIQGGAYKIGSTVIVNSNRDLTNIGTVSSTALVVTGNSFIGNSSTHDADARLHVAASDTSPDLSATTPSSYTAAFTNSDGAYGMLFATYGSGAGEIQQRRVDGASKYPLNLNPHGGNVGIGTTNPSGKLHVRATDTTGDIRLGGGNGANNHRIFISAHATAAYIDSYGGDAYNSLGIQSSVLHLNSAANTGNVGIGTNSPNDGKLQVYSNSTSDWAGYFYNQNTSGIGLHVETNAHGTEQLLRLSSLNGSGGSNTVKMLVRADGNVGIGNTTPNTPLAVTANASANAISLRARSADDYSFMQFYNNAGNTLRGQIYSHSNSIGFTTGTDGSAGNDLYIKDGVGVGIGTTSPQHKLDVYSTADISMRIHRPSSGLGLTDTCGIGFSHRGDTNTSTSDTRAGIFSTYNGSLFLCTEPGGNLNSNPVDHHALSIVGSERNVGIGTVAPLAKLDVHLDQTSGTLTASNYAHFGSQAHGANSLMGITLGYKEPNLNYRKVGIVAEGLGDNAARQDFHILVNTVNSAASVQKSDSKFMIDGLNGNVGIKTTTPDHPLEVVGAISSADTGLQKATFANVGNDMVLVANAGQTNVSSNIILKTSQSGGSATERMRIDSSGNMILGTSGTVRRDLGSATSPTLSLEGTFPAINLRDDSGTGAFYGINGSTVYLGGHSNTLCVNTYVGGEIKTRVHDVGNGGSFEVSPVNTSNNAYYTNTVFAFYHYYKTNAGAAYAHMKTNFPTGGNTGQFGMIAIEATGYKYNSAQTVKGMWGFHNWNGGTYSSTAENLISSGGFDFCHSTYVSSDGFIVLVANAGGSGSTYLGARLDFVDIQADYAPHSGSNWPPKVTAISYTNNTTGAY